MNKELHRRRCRAGRAAPRRVPEAFGADRWSRKYQSIAALWLRAREPVIPHFAVAPEIREIICTTNSIELLHVQLRKISKARGYFPGDEAALKLI